MKKRQIDGLTAFSWGVVGVALAILVIQLAGTFVWEKPFNTPLFAAIFLALVIFVYRWIRHVGEVEKKDRIIGDLKREIYELGGSPNPWVACDENEVAEWEDNAQQIRLTKGARTQLRKILGENALE